MIDNEGLTAGIMPAGELAAVLEGITDDDILDGIIGKEGGVPPVCGINASIRMMRGTPEDPEVVTEKGFDVNFCTVGISTYDGEHAAAVLTFETPGDSYLRDLESLLDDYGMMLRDAGDELDRHAGDTESVWLPDFVLTFVPEAYEGFAYAQMSSPIDWTRMPDGNGDPSCMRILFDMDDITYSVANVDAEAIERIRREESEGAE